MSFFIAVVASDISKVLVFISLLFLLLLETYCKPRGLEIMSC